MSPLSTLSCFPVPCGALEEESPQRPLGPTNRGCKETQAWFQGRHLPFLSLRHMISLCLSHVPDSARSRDVRMALELMTGTRLAWTTGSSRRDWGSWSPPGSTFLTHVWSESLCGLRGNRTRPALPSRCPVLDFLLPPLRTAMCPSRLGKQLVPQQLPSPTSFAESEVLRSLEQHGVPCRAHDGGRTHGPPSPGSEEHRGLGAL